MSGYPYGGHPQYPPPQNSIYPQLHNPANAPVPGQGAPSYPNPTQNPQYGFQGAFSYPSQPGMPQPSMQPMPGQPPQYGQSNPGHALPSAMSYPGIAPTAPLPTSAPNFGYPGPGYPTATPQPPAQPVEWIPANSQTAHMLSDRAIVAGYEGWDGSPLWVIRARFRGELVPGKLAIKHHVAYVAWGGDENAVQEFEVCCAKPEKVRWIESHDGMIPPNAIAAGNTSAGEPLYIGRAKHEKSLTPGKVHPSHKVLYISYAGKEVPHKVYEILCAV